MLPTLLLMIYSFNFSMCQYYESLLVITRPQAAIAEVIGGLKDS
jgi:hypothetical protein